MRDKALKHAASMRDTYLNDLIEFLKIPSVSTSPGNQADVKQAAEWLAGQMREAGIENVQVFSTPRHPIVCGDWLHADGAPTVLVYGHYDVQPVDPIDLWETGPFEPEIRGGELYARGSSDDKGQMYLHVKAVQSMLAANGVLPVNVKFIFEGEEEIGSPNLDPFITSHLDLLAADSVLISDSRILTPDQPSIVYALRGLSYMEFKVRGPARDLHSGSYGGAVHNPAQLVAEICAAMHDENGTIQIPGFYDRVVALSDDERKALSEVGYGVDQWAEETGLKTPWGEKEYTLLERLGARPTCEVNGIYGGFMEEGAKTVIPAEAGAKVSMRLVADQDPYEIADLFESFVRSFIPDDYEVTILRHGMGYGALTPIDAFEMKAAAAAYEATWGVAPVFTREGGSIPVVATFQNELKARVVLMGFGLDDNIHSPNEHFRVEHYHRGVDTVIHYLFNLAEG